MTRRAVVALALGAGVLGVAALFPGAAPAGAAEPPRLHGLPALYEDGKGTGLRHPESVASDGAARLAVADTGNGRIVLYDVSGDKVTAASEIRVPEIVAPLKVSFGPQGVLLVLDGRAKKIARLSAAGAFEGFVAPPDDAARAGFMPRSLRVGPDGALYVLDVAAPGVVVLAPDGKVRRRIAFPPDTRGLSDLERDGRGVLYALESVGRRLLVARPEDAAFAPLANLADETAFPVALAADAAGRIAIADQASGGIVFYALDGTFRGRQSGMGWKDGFLRSPSGLAFGPQSTLYVADRSNNRVAAFGVGP